MNTTTGSSSETMMGEDSSGSAPSASPSASAVASLLAHTHTHTHIHTPIVQSWRNGNTAAAMACSNSILGTRRQRRRQRRQTLPELLASRQAVGKPRTSRVGDFSRRGVPLDLLSSRSAWNSRRMQNMILVVGPSTPASLLMSHAGTSTTSAPSLSSSSNSSSSSDAVSEGGGEQATTTARTTRSRPSAAAAAAAAATTTRRSQWVRRRPNDDGNDNDHHDNSQEDMEEDDDEENEDGDDSKEDDDDDDDDVEDGEDEDAHQMLENALLDFYSYNTEEGESEEDEEEDEYLRNNNHASAPRPVPSMRHGGCINTASWMDCGWNLSTAGSCSSPSREALSTEECPTQLVTSGDDLLVKFWDVRQTMGMTSPLAGGYSTICPFSAPDGGKIDSVRSKWRRYYSTTHSDGIAGSVLPLATLSTGHMNNIFHVTPLKGQPGKVATCGADGFLRLTDLESGNSTVVVSPAEHDDDDFNLGRLLPAGLVGLRPAMCFSHHFLSRNTGLLCTERGLRRFDLRLPPREQSVRNLLGGSLRGCKACAIWSLSKSNASLEEGDSAYIFAGGASPEVALCDLRMTDGTSSKVVQKYAPRSLSDQHMVSVSGIDVSRDGQELLVSYESDQVYTFPVFPQSNGSAGPTVDEIACLTSKGGETKVLPELACYGGHLNRFTFLKNAKYAGPRDEYICTGSDSGRAWIYEKSNGSVVSFLNADHSTCNGVVPHPTLPFFITYGIDSTAKLWRATTPVDSDVDDSTEGRQKCARKQKYEMSATVKDWGSVQKHLKKLDCEEVKDLVDILPDQIPSAKDMQYRGRFGAHSFRDSAAAPRLGNDLHNLPTILLKNYYDCVRGILREDAPVESGATDFKHRISLIRLRHQADRLGLRWNPSLPWQFELPKKNQAQNAQPFNGFGEMHRADLVPDFPSDWIPYDPEMTKSPWDFNDYFHTKEYGGFYTERYSELVCDERFVDTEAIFKVCEQQVSSDGTSAKNEEDQKDERSINKVVTTSDDGQNSHDGGAPEQTNYAQSVYDNLYETMKLLKDAGNLALQEGDLDLAAQRYDKAIRYGAVATMSFPSKGLDFAAGRRELLKENGGYHLEWGPLIRVLIVTRLNLALLFLKPHFERIPEAAEQAKLALYDLNPFCAKKGKIMKGAKLDQVYRDDEPEATYLDVMKLQAKAYFRLGSAQHELGEYSDAISAFEKSVCSTRLAKAKPDNLVLRRLSEAKREHRRKSERQRKKFKFAFGSSENEKNGCQLDSDE